MFEFKKLEVLHWDYWQRFTLPLDSNIITIIGPNGSGKTTLLDALRTLLNIDCSSGRDYKRYVRRNNQAWLRGVVANTRSMTGRYPFFPLISDQITLACRVRKKGGDWQRQYVIAEGDVSIEALDKHEDWLGVRDYAQRLESAGLTQAIKRVLSLEQGDTDKLCEFTPKALLSLVFDVFGDKEALDNYNQAKNEQREIQRELDELQVNLASLGARLREAEVEVESYNQWQRLQNDMLRLESEMLPRAELAERKFVIDEERLQLRNRRRSLRAQRAEANIVGDGHDDLARAINEARQNEEQANQALLRCEAQFLEARDRLRDNERILRDQDKLKEQFKLQAAGVDLAAVAKQVESLRSQLAKIDQNIEAAREREAAAQTQLRAASQGERIDPPFVTEFTRALTAEKVDYVLLADIIEIKDASWQRAIEGILAPYRHVVLLASPKDREKAWKLGQEHKYRHYIVADRARAPVAEAGSLLDVIQFRDEPPDWLPDLLNSVKRVDSVGAGAKIPARQSWMTRDGFFRDRRGGRYIGVEPREFFFGRSAQVERASDVQRVITEARNEMAKLEGQKTEFTRQIRESEVLLRGSDAGRLMESRAAEFLDAEENIAACRDAVQQNGLELAAAQDRKREAAETRHRLDRSMTERDAKRDTLLKRTVELEQELNSQRRQWAERVAEFRRIRQPMPKQWYSVSSLRALADEYESADAVRRDIGRLRRRLEEGHWVEDERVLAKREKLGEDHRRLEGDLSSRQIHHYRLQRITDEARAGYMNVLRATVRRYGKNLKALGDLAGIGVDVEPPHLDNDDVILNQAGLEVKFNFDQKGMIGMNDGEASGGQQVMKSLILLVGLMMDESRAGGFVFIDEPFAHLDIFNIDRVGGFLEATRAQYILTTPNTNNLNVFKPSDLTLVTQKRRHPDPWAPPVGFVKRDPASRQVAAVPASAAG